MQKPTDLGSSASSTARSGMEPGSLSSASASSVSSASQTPPRGVIPMAADMETTSASRAAPRVVRRAWRGGLSLRADAAAASPGRRGRRSGDVPQTAASPERRGQHRQPAGLAVHRRGARGARSAAAAAAVDALGVRCSSPPSILRCCPTKTAVCSGRAQAMQRLAPRDRMLLGLRANGLSYRDIAAAAESGRRRSDACWRARSIAGVALPTRRVHAVSGRDHAARQSSCETPDVVNVANETKECTHDLSQ